MRSTDSKALGCAPEDDRFDPIIDDFEPRKRPYKHFDLALTDRERESFCPTLSDIECHEFWPLFGFEKKQRRVKPSEPIGIEIKVKSREIRFASHRDAAILEYYSRHLSIDYEKTISSSMISPFVLAYRSGVGDNIHQAKSAFDEIREAGDCTAIAMDISGFFDHISHSVLKEQIKTVRGVGELLAHDYHIFKNMTSYAWIESDHIKHRMVGKKAPAGRICSAIQLRKYFREKKPSIIQRNSKPFGIPQGTPVSGLYANISMLSFDKWAIEYMASMGGSYRRYSDDIALIIPGSLDFSEVLKRFYSEIKAIKLELNPSKTEISRFEVKDGNQQCDQEFQYLGFTFDGRKIQIRSSSLNNYYRKMRRGIYGKIKIANHKKVKKSEIFLRELYRKYTHYGKSRNFIRYALRASDIMESTEIRRQVSRHLGRFRETLAAAIKHYYE